MQNNFFRGNRLVMKEYGYLAIAIMSEVIATTTLKAVASFTRPIPSAIVILGYGSAFYWLSLTLRTMNVGVAYAIWSGVGVVLVALLSWLFYGQHLDPAGLVGMALIIAGVLVLNLCSKTVAH